MGPHGQHPCPRPGEGARAMAPGTCLRLGHMARGAINPSRSNVPCALSRYHVVWCDVARSRVAWCGAMWCGMLPSGVVPHGVRDIAWHTMVPHAVARCHMVWHGTVPRGTAWCPVDWRGRVHHGAIPEPWCSRSSSGAMGSLLAASPQPPDAADARKG